MNSHNLNRADILDLFPRWTYVRNLIFMINSDYMRSWHVSNIFAISCNIDVIHLQDKFNQYLSDACRTRLIWRHRPLFATTINRGLWWATCVDGTPRFLAKTWAVIQWASRDFYILFASTGPCKPTLVPAGLYGALCYSTVFEFLRTVLPVLRYPLPFLFSSLAELSPRSFVRSSEILCHRISRNIVHKYIKDKIKKYIFFRYDKIL